MPSEHGLLAAQPPHDAGPRPPRPTDIMAAHAASASDTTNMLPPKPNPDSTGVWMR